jgi:hypothetical protein
MGNGELGIQVEILSDFFDNKAAKVRLDVPYTVSIKQIRQDLHHHFPFPI